MSSNSASSRPAASNSRPWRQALIWGAFAVTLIAGLVFATLYGADAPVLLDAATTR